MVLVVVVLFIKTQRSPCPIIFAVNLGRQPPPRTNGRKGNLAGRVNLLPVLVPQFHDQNGTVSDGVNNLFGNPNFEYGERNSRNIRRKGHLRVQMVQIQSRHGLCLLLSLMCVSHDIVMTGRRVHYRTTETTAAAAAANGAARSRAVPRVYCRRGTARNPPDKPR